ncbi:DUF1080 domain-containing protein [Daejeonella sp.]|uniref:3-keto-disaccharide hydrolase n=1 Tax=Daejeonella sp. TaxID=2805397 RepID=UPI0030C1867E
MKTTLLVTVALISSLILVESCGSVKSNSNQPKTSESRSISLFNGKDLAGWYTFIKDRGRDADPKQVFTVQNGMIRVSGEEYGCITTNEEYSNYKLTVEFKWGQKTFAPRIDNARDNGILLHSTGQDGGYSGTWMHSIECQIIEGGTGDFLVVGNGSDKFALTSNVAPKKQGRGNVFMPGGQPLTINGGRIDWFARDPNWKDVLGFRGEKDVEKEAGKWNKIECVAEGDKIDIYLNGVLVNQAYRVKPTRGRIQIQSEGAEMFVRKVEIQPLAAH